MTISRNGNTYQVETEAQVRAVAALEQFPKPAVPPQVAQEIERRIRRARELAARLAHVRETLGSRYAAEFLLTSRTEFITVRESLEAFEKLAVANGFDPADFYGAEGKPALDPTEAEDRFFSGAAIAAIAFAV
jgi:hypothetical protein